MYFPNLVSCRFGLNFIFFLQWTLKSTKDLGIYKLHGEAQKNILKNLNSEAVGAIANETFSLLIPASCKALRLDLLPKVLANLRGH